MGERHVCGFLCNYGEACAYTPLPPAAPPAGAPAETERPAETPACPTAAPTGEPPAQVRRAIIISPTQVHRAIIISPTQEAMKAAAWASQVRAAPPAGAPAETERPGPARTEIEDKAAELLWRMAKAYNRAEGLSNAMLSSVVAFWQEAFDRGAAAERPGASERERRLEETLREYRESADAALIALSAQHGPVWSHLSGCGGCAAWAKVRAVLSKVEE